MMRSAAPFAPRRTRAARERAGAAPPRCAQSSFNRCAARAALSSTDSAARTRRFFDADAASDTRRSALRAFAVSAALHARAARADVYTKKEFCEKSDAESRNGVEFGCESYVTDPAKRLKMRRRALAALKRASASLDRFDADALTPQTARSVREALRRDPLDGLRTQGRRLATLSTKGEVGLRFDDALAKITDLDQKARRLDIDSGMGALLAASLGLAKAQEALRTFVAVGTEDDLLEPADIPPPKSKGADMIPE